MDYSRKVCRQKKLLFAFIFICCFLLALNVDAQDTTLLKKRRSFDLVLQVGVDNYDTVKAADGSIWVNRETPYKNYTPEELVRNVFTKNSGGTGCDGIANVKFKGYSWNSISSVWTRSNRALSYFSHGTLSGLGMESGLLLSTGGGMYAEGPNNSSELQALNGGTPIIDADLSALVSGNITTGAVLEFDFKPQTNSISFDYIFASEEYPEYVDGVYNDVFGFFISGPGIIGQRNIALIPGSSTPVAINNVNDHNNSQYYKDNDVRFSPYVEYDGHTTLLTTAPVSVVKGQTYHMKLTIANVYDTLVASGVFLREGSFDLGLGATNHGNMIPDMDNVFGGCVNNKLVISVIPDPSPTTIALNYLGINVNDILQPNGSPMPASIVVPANATEVTIFYKVKDTITVNGGEFIFSYKYSCSSNYVDKKIRVYSKVDPIATTAFNCATNDGSITISAAGGSPQAQISINNGANWQNINQTFTGLAEGNYTILVRDSISCHIDTLHTAIAKFYPTVDTIFSKTVCAGTIIDTIKFTSTTPGTTFTWTNDNTNIGLGSGGSNNIPSFTAKNTTNAVIVSTITVTPDFHGCEGTPKRFTITVKPAYNDTIPVTICIGDSYNQHGFTIMPTTAGLMRQTKNLTSILGCDSIVTLQLTVNPVYNIYITDTIYEDDFYIVGNNEYNTAGHYIVNLTTKAGCDSIVNLTLAIMDYPDEITAFSPFNLDGINDFFMPGFKIQVFNRYGAIIYETKSKEQRNLGWDGKNSKGKDVEPGLYFYILYNANGEPQIKNSVEVLKK